MAQTLAPSSILGGTTGRGLAWKVRHVHVTGRWKKVPDIRRRHNQVRFLALPLNGSMNVENVAEGGTGCLAPAFAELTPEDPWPRPDTKPHRGPRAVHP